MSREDILQEASDMQFTATTVSQDLVRSRLGVVMWLVGATNLLYHAPRNLQAIPSSSSQSSTVMLWWVCNIGGVNQGFLAGVPVLERSMKSTVKTGPTLQGPWSSRSSSGFPRAF